MTLLPITPLLIYLCEKRLPHTSETASLLHSKSLRYANMKEISLAEEAIISKIYAIRVQKIMIDRDLTDLYGVEKRTLKQAIRTNFRRFPEDCMFEMTATEFENWKVAICALQFRG